MGLNNKREFRTVVVYGFGPCGKTHHAADIARALGCGGVVDEWGINGDNSLKPGALHLSNARSLCEIMGIVPSDVLIVPFSAAMAAAFVVGAI